MGCGNEMRKRIQRGGEVKKKWECHGRQCQDAAAAVKRKIGYMIGTFFEDAKMERKKFPFIVFLCKRTQNIGGLVSSL